MDIQTCLESVVGITEKECECFSVPVVEGEPIVDPTLSHSGYFIDDMEEGIPLKYPANARDCGDDDVFNIMINARRDAVKEFITDFPSFVSEFTLPRYSEIISSIGEIEKNKNVMLAIPMEDNVGTLLRMRQIRGATAHLDRIRIRCNGDLIDSSLRILSSADAFVNPIMDPITFSAPSGVLTEIEIEDQIHLPLCDSFGKPLTYSVTYDRQGANPFNYRLHCGCTSKPKPAWDRYMDIVGLNVEDPIDISAWDKIQNRTYGLIIDVKVNCKSMDWICRPFDSEWRQPGYWRVVAKILQLMSINKVIGYILNSTQLNRYTLVKTEFLYGKRNHNRKEIAERMSWLAQMIPADAVDCYSCKASGKTKLAEILV